MKTATVIALAMLAGAAPAFAQTPAAAAAPAAPARLPADSLAIARRLAGWFVGGFSDSLYGAMPADMQREMGSATQLGDQLGQLAAQIGSETSLVEERWVRRNGRRQYWRIARYSSADEPVVLRLVIQPDGTLGGIGINPLSQVPPVDPERR